MGVVVRIFRNNDKIDLNETTDVLVSILNKLKYSYSYINKYISYDEGYNNIFGTTAPDLIDENGEPEGLCFYVSDKFKSGFEEEYEIIGKEMVTAVFGEDVGKGPISFLEIIYRYFLKFPNDLFWTDYLVYTKDDIEKIYAHKEKDVWWCCRKPEYLI